MNSRVSGLALVTVVILLAAALLVPATSYGAFAATAVDGPGSSAADSLAAPANFQVSFHCQLLGALLPVADLSWQPSSSAWANGYVIDRVSGSTVLTSSTIANTATSTTSDGGLLPHLSVATTYTWRLRTTFHSWTSAEVTVTSTTPLAC